MRTWLWIVALTICLAAGSCGISGQTGGPDPDKTDLEILQVRVEPTDSSAVITWRTSMQTVGTLSWGRLQAAPGRPISSNPSGEHNITLSDLESDTRYWYQIAAATPLGQRASTQPDTFRTLVSQDLFDTTAPVFRDIQVVGITPTTATVTWVTDDRTIGQLYYGPSGAYGSNQPDSAYYARSHALTVTDLAQNQLYHFRLWARNRAGLSAYSDDGTFQTAEEPLVMISPDTVRVVGNDAFSFAVSVRNARNVAGICFLIVYDPQVVEILSVGEGTWFRQTDGFLLLREYEDSQAGRMKWDASWKINFENGTAVGTLANGGGDVAVIRARTKGEGTISPLQLIDTDQNGDGKPETRLLDHNRSDLPFHVRSGLVIKQVP